MRLFAFYLPQFHETEENNEWWGKGFTEWTHVSKAKPLFRGHCQPVVPFENRYYDLMEKETVQWQTSLMKEYGVDGLAYYHYYFCGKKLLNKPAENLLKWKDIDQPFFFCWANHTWYQAINGVKKVLLEQTYGAQPEWEEHFQYLLPFFKDPRYEKKNNMPVFLLFDSGFAKKHDMMDYFDKRCREEGFAGIYLMETLSNPYGSVSYEDFRRNLCSQTKHVFLREPGVFVSQIMTNRVKRYTPLRIIRKLCRELAFKGKLRWVDHISGNKLFHKMLENPFREKDVCHGLFAAWDNTPRHGVRGYIITPPKKELFMKYAKMIQKDEYVIFNAWNEWAEGMMLEPTEKDGFKYLSWIKEWKDQIKNND